MEKNIFIAHYTVQLRLGVLEIFNGGRITATTQLNYNLK